MTSSKWHLKVVLGVIAFAIVVSVILFTQALVKELIRKEQSIIKLYTEIFKHYTDPNSNMEDIPFFIDRIASTISFPMILTDDKGNPQEDFETYSLNVPIDSTMSYAQKREYFRNMVKKMAEQYPPILIENNEGKLLSKCYYTHSALIDKLNLFPYVAIIVIAIFVIVGYAAFSMSRRSEQSKVWVGMAKEAAHQLGTPLSSLLAWIEILRYGKDDPKIIDDTLKEMSNDVSRLNTIATRFSKIGSQPEMKLQNVTAVIEDVISYFEKRLPHLGRRVEIVRNLDSDYYLSINTELFAWVIENLIKNAAEAIENKTGQIYFSIKVHPQKKLIIYVRDTGKGMNSKLKRQVFNPGFTTKKRGWGLGLSLCKRIIEDYHGGKIYIKDSVIGKGTTFAIELPYTAIEQTLINN